MEDQSAVIEFLAQPESYGLAGGVVEQHRTHGAIVFLAGHFAYKLKRAVRFPYMDYSTAELRRQMCARELSINQAISPSLYLDIRPIVRRAGYLSFGRTGDANVVDWVVVMRRFDQSALLEEQRKAGKLDRALMLALADVIAAFHSKAERTPNFGGTCSMKRVVEENREILGRNADVLFASVQLAKLSQCSEQALHDLDTVLENRRNAGFVRRCHGDLHLNNICVMDGNPVLFDALEFSDDFSCIDVFYDLAFLLMDLDSHALRGHANAVFNRYLEQTGDYAGLAALPFFLSCRAAIRAHVTIAAEGVDEEAQGLVQLAENYLVTQQPRLIAIGGLSGAGKSTLARELAPSIGRCPGAVVLRSDVLRKQMMGVAETAKLDDRAYDTDVTRMVYARMCELAAIALTAGHSVIADAVFGARAEQQMLADMAYARRVRFDGIWLEGTQSVLAARIEGRTGDASDATVAVLNTQIRTSAIPSDWRRIDSTFCRPARLLDAARSLL